MKLTSAQETKVQDFVDAQGLKIPKLRDDLVDHLCCVIEFEIEKGEPFEDLLNKAVADLAPNGLIEIEHQTMFLLNAKRILAMKKVMYFIGFIGSLSLTGGVTFKLLNMPAANQFFMVGYLTLLLVFIPLLTFDRYKVAIARALSERLKIILGASAAVISGLAGLFKILHLQGASVLLMAGAFIFAFGFLPFFFFTMYKKSIA